MIQRIFETILYRFRELIWDYPNILFLGKESALNSFRNLYISLRPFSHFILGFLVYFCIFSLFFYNTQAFIPLSNEKYIEGTIVGVDDEGQLLGLSRINPLVPSPIQLEKDISNLVYESLVKVTQDGKVEEVLIESFGAIKPGNHYRFKLKKGVKWHDGETLTTEDVKSTFYLLRTLNKNPDTASNFSNVLTNQFDDIKIIDDYTFEFMLKSKDAVLPIPYYFETISFKILPSAYTDELDENSILTSKPKINLSPIGTGPYQNISQNEKEHTITLIRNENYYLSKPKIKKIIFKLFPNELSAYKQLQSSQIHAISGLSSETIKKAEKLNNYKVIKSNTLYNQYWALYFNFSDNSTTPFFKNINVRRAIASAINKKEIIRSIADQGEEAVGAIPKNSFAYNEDADRTKFNPEYAQELLEKEGWKLNERTGIREKDGQVFSFELVYTNNVDRNKVADIIKENLGNIGIEVFLKPETIQTVNDAYILPRRFDALLYGQTTWIDPDRYELFHSSQTEFFGEDKSEGSTGLNISGYRSEAMDTEIIEQEVVRVPKVDILLEDGRSFIDLDKRKEVYTEFQDIIAQEVPVVFLYHPSYSYIVNTRVKNIQLEGMCSLEERFKTVYEWTLM
ncbi:hypothetical protein GF362_07170 [Candidatus Dojkabacteria bacterium]|nr:hypothetical protein [Candidatus Dojkabacteria bacterium]